MQQADTCERNDDGDHTSVDGKKKRICAHLTPIENIINSLRISDRQSLAVSLPRMGEMLELVALRAF